MQASSTVVCIRLMLLLLTGLASAPAMAQEACALPEESPLMFGITAQREGTIRGSSEVYWLVQTGGLTAFRRSNAKDPVNTVNVDLGASDTLLATLPPLYALAREVVCGVRFSEKSTRESSITYDAPRMEVWVEVGDVALGTRLLAEPLPAAAAELFERLGALTRRRE